jgi:hypothetical protein
VIDHRRYVVPGMADRIPALPVAGHVLARMRTLLVQGTSVVCLADNEFGGKLFTNPLRLAGRLRVPVILVWAELAKDGVVDVTFEPAPHPLCESDEAIAQNLDHLRGINDGVLRSLGIPLGA